METKRTGPTRATVGAARANLPINGGFGGPCNLDSAKRSERARSAYIPIAIRSKAWIIQQILLGRTTTAIASDLGITCQAISTQLAKDPEYRNARRSALQRKLLQAQLDLDIARHSRSPKGLSITLARKRFRRLLAFAEAHFPLHWPSYRTPSFGNPDSDAWRTAWERNKARKAAQALDVGSSKDERGDE